MIKTILAVVLLAEAAVARADMPVPAPQKAAEAGGHYEKGLAASKAGDHAKALPLFEKAVAAAPDDADALTMLAYSQRKLGQLDEAFATYRRALMAKPKNPKAREYLGEAHLQALLREIEILKSYGKDGAEELADLVKDVKDAAAKL